MPLNPPSLTSGFLVPNLVSVGNIGQSVPTYSLGVSVGVCQYLSALAKVTTVDTGVAGVGTTTFPLIVPPPLLQGALYQGFSSMGILGQMAPLHIQGLTTGLTQGWLALALLFVQHPNVGTGAAVAKIIAPTAIPSMISGLASVGMTGEGPTKIARAIGMALDTTFAAYFQPVPIVGSASPVPSAGVGIGVVL
jgi:hypothetical protein